MVSLVAAILSPQNWSPSVLLLVASVAIFAVIRLSKRAAFHSGAKWTDRGVPILGSLPFYTRRGDYLREGKERSANGHFNFFFGPYPIVAISGEAARSAYFTTRGLDLSAGFKKLFSAGPDVDSLLGRNMATYFVTLFKRLTGKDHLATCLPYLNKDAHDSLSAIDTSVPMDPFVVLHDLICKMTHRTVGCHDVAEDPELRAKTMKYYDMLDASSALSIMFPWLPTPTKMNKLWGGGKLHMLFLNIIKERRRTGQRAEDTVQVLMDKGESDMVTAAFIIGALFAGLINTAIQAAWIICYLAYDPVWYAKVQAEVDAAVAKHRTSEHQTPAEVLQTLSVDTWESEFPSLDLGVQDSIRLNLMGASMRQNISGKDIVLGDTGVIIPKDAFAVYSISDVHMDETVYKNPGRWDPGRYLSDRGEDKAKQHGYVGWGSGLHPCLGMRIAKMELFVSTATFVAMFNFKAVDKLGKPRTEPLPGYNCNDLQPRRMTGTIYLKCEPRY